jgi:hypothetical protein
MRFKMLPAPPADLDRVSEAQRAVPLVPGDEDDCCARLQRRLGFPSRDVSRTWLTFLRALELARETDAGFSRTDREPTVEHLRRSVLDHVLLAPETLAAVAAITTGEEKANGSAEWRDGDPAAETDDDPTAERGASVDAVFDRIRDAVPTYEHHKNPDTWESIWCDRTADLLGWLALLGFLESVNADGDAADAGADGVADAGDGADENRYVLTDRGREALDGSD